MDLKEESILGDAIHDHWYYVSKARMLESHLDHKPNTVLDVGAGVGWFSRRLLKDGYAKAATCVDPGYPEEREEVVDGRPISFRRSIDSTGADVVLLMDVLEHVDDDVGLLREYVQKSSKQTRFFITVPAFQFLWSAHDEFLEHRRRYTLPMLERVVAEAGLKPVRSHYYFGHVFPAAVVVRLLGRFRKADRSDMKPAHPMVNSVLKKVCGLENIWMRRNRLAGLSVVCLCGHA